MKPRDTLLNATVEDGDLVIRIGASRLAYCAIAKNGGILPKNAKVSDPIIFAEDAPRSQDRNAQNPA